MKIGDSYMHRCAGQVWVVDDVNDEFCRVVLKVEDVENKNAKSYLAAKSQLRK